MTPRIPSARTTFLVSYWIFRVSVVIFRASGLGDNFGYHVSGMIFPVPAEVMNSQDPIDQDQLCQLFFKLIS